MFSLDQLPPELIVNVYNKLNIIDKQNLMESTDRLHNILSWNFFTDYKCITDYLICKDFDYEIIYNIHLTTDIDYSFLRIDAFISAHLTKKSVTHSTFVKLCSQ